MALATRCPHCQTAFKVANDQLKLHAGLVRCGSCQRTFNAVENLIPADGPKSSAPVPTSAQVASKPVPVTPAAPVTQSTPTVPAARAATTNASSAAPAPVAATKVSQSTETVADSKLSAAMTETGSIASMVSAANSSPAPAVTASSAASTTAGAATSTTASTTTSTTIDAAQATSASPIIAEAAKPAPVVDMAGAATVQPVTKNTVAGVRPATEVLAAISKAEKEFEAEAFDKPRSVTPAQNTVAAVPAPDVTDSSESMVDSLVVSPAVGTEARLNSRVEPRLEPAITSSSALDFDLGDGGFLLPSEEINDADLARVELETRAALMDPPTADWSVSDQPEDRQHAAVDEAASPTAASQDEIPLPASVNKVWRHKDHGDAPELDGADSIADEAPHQEAYIGEEEAALANHAAINEDSSSDAEEEHKPGFVIQAEKQRARKRMATIFYSLMLLLLLPALLAQSAYVLRNQLAVRVPETRPYLQDACKFLSCQVSLPAQIEKIVIDSNELQSLAPERNVFMLVMQLQNQSDVTQAWPHIELVLNDVKEKPLLQRAFKPEDYLAEKDKLAKGFAAGGEQNIKLYFELPTLKAAGFHVGIFYP